MFSSLSSNMMYGEPVEDIQPRVLERHKRKLLHAAHNGDWDTIESVAQLEFYKEVFINSENEISANGNTIFHTLGEHGHANILGKLLSEYCGGKMYWNRGNGSGDRALHLAARWGHYQAVKVLLDGGASEHLREKNKFGETVFHTASMKSRDDRIIRELVKCTEKMDEDSQAECLCAKTKTSEYTFFHYLVIRKLYDVGYRVLEEHRTGEMLPLLRDIACGIKDKNKDTALNLLLKNESSFFQSRRGRSDVMEELDRQFVQDDEQMESDEDIQRHSLGKIEAKRGNSGWRWPWTGEVSPIAKLLVKLLHVWSDPYIEGNSYADNTSDTDTVVLYLGNLGLEEALSACFGRRERKPLCAGENDQKLTVLHIAARDRMERFINWFETAECIDEDWKRVLLSGTDSESKTALHYAAMPAAEKKRFNLGWLATEIVDDYKWFKKIEGLMPSDLISRRKKPSNMSEPEETAEEMFHNLHKDMAAKNAESIRTMATTSMSLVAAFAFATTFTLPSGVTESSGGQLKRGQQLSFTVFTGAYVLGLFYAVTTIIASAYLYVSPFDVQNFLATVPKRFYMCLWSLCMCLLSVIVAFACNLRLSLDKYHLSKAIFLYTFTVVGPLTLVPYFAFQVFRHIKAYPG